MLNEEAGDLAASWRCRLHSWRVTQHRRNVDPRKKAQLLRSLLGWAQRHGFREDGLRVLRQTWRETSFSEADASLWAERLGGRRATSAAGRRRRSGQVSAASEPVRRGDASARRARRRSARSR